MKCAWSLIINFAEMMGSPTVLLLLTVTSQGVGFGASTAEATDATTHAAGNHTR